MEKVASTEYWRVTPEKALHMGRTKCASIWISSSYLVALDAGYTSNWPRIGILRVPPFA